MLNDTVCSNRIITILLKYMYRIKYINASTVNTSIEHSINEGVYHGNMKSIILGGSTKIFEHN